MNIRDCILARRSIRKFLPKAPKAQDLKELIFLGRLYASGANQQPIRFALISQKANCEKMFSHLAWAKYLPDFTIAEDERPTAYILLLDNAPPSPFFEVDAGGAAANIMLAAAGLGLGSCMLKIPSPEKAAEDFDFGSYLPRYAIALGYPAVESRVVGWEGSPKYRRDERGNFQVPKRSVDEVLIYTDEK